MVKMSQLFLPVPHGCTLTLLLSASKATSTIRERHDKNRILSLDDDDLPVTSKKTFVRATKAFNGLLGLQTRRKSNFWS